MLLRILLLCLLMAPTHCIAQPCDLEFEYIGKAVQTEGMHVWGSSPVIGPDGKVHLYVARWSMSTQKKFSGWYKECEIAHYVGDQPEGPFEFVRVAVPDADGQFNSPHNPTIKKIDDKYVLCFIVNENNKLKTQRIVMYVADDLQDDWQPAAGAEADGTILRKSTVPGGWNVNAQLGVSNPSLVKHNGKYLLYDKSVVKPNPQAKRGRYNYGVAISDQLEGPYTHHPKRVTPSSMQLEDAYAFTMNQQVYMLSRDFSASKGSSGGGLLWKSEDGLFFDAEKTTRAYEDLAHYVGKESLSEGKAYRGKKDGHLERAQVLAIDGKPAYLYLATGVNTSPGHGSCSHVFKITERTQTDAASPADDVPEGKVYTYKQQDGKTQEIEVHFPQGHDPAQDAVPGIIMFHGGGWSNGNRSQFRYLCHYFASRGIVSATSSYQLANRKNKNAGEGSHKRVCITDAKSAIRWYKQNAGELGIDPNRIITGGGSAGGHICLLATTNPGLNDPNDPADFDTSVAAYLLFNPALSNADAKDPEINAIEHLKADFPPAIVFFGTEDRWLKGWNPAFKKMKKLGVKNLDSWVANEQGHSFFNDQPWTDVTIKACDEFLIKHGLLEGSPTLKDPESGEVLTNVDNDSVSGR